MAKPVKKGKAVDKWKAKKKYEVLAPDIFNNVPIGPIFADEENVLEGRLVETTLSKLVNSNQHHIKVKLRVVGTNGFNALTAVKSVNLSRAYIASQTTPGIDIIEDSFVTTTQDGKKVRVKTIIFTKRKAHKEQKTALRKLIQELAIATATRLNYDHFVQEVVFGKIGSQIFNKGKKIMPLGRVEIRSMVLLS